MINNKELYRLISKRVSRDITISYSSSFSSAVSLLDDDVADAIYSIYGFVRIADEIVDTWRPAGMDSYLNDLSLDLKRAIKTGFSSNFVIHNYAQTVRQYKIPVDLVDAFLKSMRMDISKRQYSPGEYKAYIYGSAEAVGLMCLMVFVGGDKRKYNDLIPSARALGSAFQKINFLRDYAADKSELGRIYFPEIYQNKLNDETKLKIIDDIKHDLDIARPAILKLPKSSRYGVELAYRYFKALNDLAAKTPANQIVKNRLSLSKSSKSYIYSVVKAKRRFTK